MKKENETNEKRQIYKILKKSETLKNDIADYVSLNGLTSGMFTGTALFGVKAIVDACKSQPKSNLVYDIGIGALLAAIGAISAVGHNNAKKNVQSDYKKMAKIVQNEADIFTDEDGKNILSINKDINKLMSTNNFLATVEGMVITAASFLSLHGLDTKYNFDLKTKCMLLGIASAYYLLAGGLLYISKKNQSDINYKTGLLADKLCKPYITKEKVLQRK